MNACSRTIRIGYLPLYVDYYESICADFPRQKAAMARTCAEQLKPLGDVVWNGALISDRTQAKACGQALAAAHVDCVVVVPTIAVFSGISAASLEPINAPVLLWNAQQIETVGPGYSMVEIVRNTGQIGVQALANHLTRQGRWYRVVTGWQHNPRTDAELARFFRIVATAKAVREARLLAVGGPFPLMTDILLDDVVTAKYLGAQVVARIDATALTAAYNEVSNERAAAHVDRVKQTTAIHELSDDELHRSARLCEALDDLATTYDVDAGTLNCHGDNCLANEAIGVAACYSLGVQNQHRRSFTCTGDLPTALAMLLVKRLTGSAMYTEVQVMDEVRQAMVLANSGEGEEGMRRSACPTRLVGNTNFRGAHGRGASFAYPLKSGPATVVSLTPTPTGPKPFRLVVAEGEILDESLNDVGALAGWFRFANFDLHTGYARWLEAGPVHHAATTSGHHAGDLADVCKLLDIEFVGI